MKKYKKTKQIRVSLGMHAYLKECAKEQGITIVRFLDEIVFSTLTRKAKKQVRKINNKHYGK